MLTRSSTGANTLWASCDLFETHPEHVGGALGGGACMRRAIGNNVGVGLMD